MNSIPRETDNVKVLDTDKVSQAKQYRKVRIGGTLYDADIVFRYMTPEGEPVSVDYGKVYEPAWGEYVEATREDWIKQTYQNIRNDQTNRDREAKERAKAEEVFINELEEWGILDEEEYDPQRKDFYLEALQEAKRLYAEEEARDRAEYLAAAHETAKEEGHDISRFSEDQKTRYGEYVKHGRPQKGLTAAEWIYRTITQTHDWDFYGYDDEDYRITWGYARKHGLVKEHKPRRSVFRSAQSLLTRKPAEWIKNSYFRFQAGKVGMFWGTSGVGKSWVILYQAVEIARLYPDEYVVVVANEEVGQYITRLTAIEGGIPDNLLIDDWDVDLSNADSVQAFTEEVIENLQSEKPITIIYFDTLAKSASGDMERDKDAKLAMRHMWQMAKAGNCSVVFTNHTPKSNERKFIGSQVLYSQSDFVAGMVFSDGDREVFEDKQRNAEKAPGVSLTLKNSQLKQTTRRRSALAAKIDSLLADGNEMPSAELQAATGKTRAQILKALNELPHIKKVGGKNGTYRKVE